MADIRDRVKGAIDTGAEKAKNLTDSAANQAREAQNQGGGMMDTVKDKAESALHAAGDYAHQARDLAGQAADRVQHWAEDAYEHAGHYAKDFGQELSTLIRRYPVQALLVGFGVGLLLGRVVRA
jgi:ElaB/YqjD/DUF883 family membrane-anchored ribosome-binding protein